MAKRPPKPVKPAAETPPPPGALDTAPGKDPVRVFKAGRNAGGDSRSTAAATRS
jgi:hypothetical protein